MHLDRRLVGWGLTLILIGAVPLTVRAGYLDTTLVAGWPALWPLLVIGVGIGLLLHRTPGAWLGTAVVSVTIGLMGGGLLASGFGGFPGACGQGGSTPFATKTGAFGASGTFNIEFDCGTLDLGTTDGSNWQVSGSDGEAVGPEIATSAASVTLRSGMDRGIRLDRGRVVWDVLVPRVPRLDLGITLNAGTGTVDLTGATLSSLNLTVNAGSLDATLGDVEPTNAVNLTLNAGDASLGIGGDAGTYNLSLNAGSLRLCVPSHAAFRVHWSGTLGSNNFDELNLVQADGETWTSQGFDPNQDHFEIQATANAGSFNLDIGGTCGA
jgi:hypothetical protein